MLSAVVRIFHLLTRIHRLLSRNPGQRGVIKLTGTYTEPALSARKAVSFHALCSVNAVGEVCRVTGHPDSGTVPDGLQLHPAVFCGHTPPVLKLIPPPVGPQTCRPHGSCFHPEGRRLKSLLLLEMIEETPLHSKSCSQRTRQIFLQSPTADSSNTINQQSPTADNSNTKHQSPTADSSNTINQQSPTADNSNTKHQSPTADNSNTNQQSSTADSSNTNQQSSTADSSNTKRPIHVLCLSTV
ncbi:hypothetical protein ACOMHN_024324 [Nucella lapillus]